VQYFRYGRWRRVVTRQYPDTVSLRYMAPPAACALNLAGLLLGVAGLAAGVPALAFGFTVTVIYLLGVIGAGLGLSRAAGLAVRLRIPLILATMHMCWGAGFLTSPKRLARRTRSATVASPLAPARARSGERP
jgi:hypothetical protein